MAVNKVVFGTETLIDLTGDTVAPEVLLAGYTAHNASGEPVEGAALIPDDVEAALTEKGVTVPDGAGISDLAALISGIEVGGNPFPKNVVCGTITPAENTNIGSAANALTIEFSPPSLEYTKAPYNFLFFRLSKKTATWGEVFILSAMVDGISMEVKNISGFSNLASTAKLISTKIVSSSNKKISFYGSNSSTQLIGGSVYGWIVVY